MGIYCKSISDGTETVHSSTKKTLTNLFRFVDWHFHCKTNRKHCKNYKFANGNLDFY